MKIVIVLFACVAAASAQNFFTRLVSPFTNFFGGGRPRPQPQPQQFQQAAPQNFGGQQFQSAPQQSLRGGQVDDTQVGSQYHYSWLHNGQTFTGQQAKGYCSGLGGGWQAISIESPGENGYVTRIIQQHAKEYIWTGASRSGSGFIWPSGGHFIGLAWSRTGGAGVPQPDNREQGGENCVAVLNNFYQDGVVWHDVACHHLKPVICERKV